MRPVAPWVGALASSQRPVSLIRSKVGGGRDGGREVGREGRSWLDWSLLLDGVAGGGGGTQLIPGLVCWLAHEDSYP